MLIFRFRGSVKYSSELENKKASIGDCYHVLYDGKPEEPYSQLVNTVYCYTGTWDSMASESNDIVYYVVETFKRAGKFKAHHSYFLTDTIVALAEINMTAGNITVLNIWPEIMNEPELRWELSNDFHHLVDANQCYKTNSGFDASLEYTRQINDELSRRKYEDF